MIKLYHLIIVGEVGDFVIGHFGIAQIQNPNGILVPASQKKILNQAHRIATQVDGHTVGFRVNVNFLLHPTPAEFLGEIFKHDIHGGLGWHALIGRNSERSQAINQAL